MTFNVHRLSAGVALLAAVLTGCAAAESPPASASAIVTVQFRC